MYHLVRRTENEEKIIYSDDLLNFVLFLYKKAIENYGISQFCIKYDDEIVADYGERYKPIFRDL